MKVKRRISAREYHIAVLNLAAVGSFTLYVLMHPAVSASQFLLLIGKYAVLTVVLATLALIAFAALKSRGQNWIDTIADRWRKDHFLTLLWPMATFTLVMPTFSAFKQRILPLAGFQFDPALSAIDRRLFGTDPGLWMHQTLGSPFLTQFLDLVYHAWFVPMTVGVGVVALCTDARTRMQYMTAYTLNWIGLASILAYLLPAAGPCFYRALVGIQGSAPFAAVDRALIADGAASGLDFLFTINIKTMLLARFNDPILSIGGGISAIPSIHNAMAMLFALVAYRFNRGFGLFMTGFAILIWIGSIYLNWHYAIDGIVGCAGAILLWQAAGWLVSLTEQDPLQPTGRLSPVT